MFTKYTESIEEMFYLAVDSGLILALVLISISYVAYKTITVYLNKRKYKHIKGPSPGGLRGFYLGMYPEICHAVQKGNLFIDKVIDWSEEFGPTFKVQILGCHKIFTNDPDFIRIVALEEDLPRYPHTYQSIVAPFNRKWLSTSLNRKRSTLYHKSLSIECLLKMMVDFNVICDNTIEKIKKQAEGKANIELQNQLRFYSMDIIATVMFGMGISSRENSLNLSDLITKILKFEDFERAKSTSKPCGNGKNTELLKSIQDLKRFARYFIENRKLEMRKSPTHYVRNDLLTAIVNNLKNNLIEMDDAIEEFLSIFVSGMETITNTLSFVIVELGRNENVFKKLKTEIDENIRGKTFITQDDLDKLEYTTCVIKETLRLWPISVSYTRATTEDIVINATLVPKDTCIIISPFLSGRNPKYFPEPENFEPDRFLKDSEESKKNIINPYTYFPFSLGSKCCIGEVLAYIEMKLFIVKFVQNFNFQLDGEQTFTAKESTIIQPLNGCRISLNNRKAQ